MEITEVKVILKEGPDKKLKAYATITIDDAFVVRNVKIIKGTKGLFVAMPSRKMREACPKCNYKNAIRSKFCNQCGGSLPEPPPRDPNQEVRQSEHRDIAHPITLECREYIQKKVLEAYEKEAGTSTSQTTEPTYKKEVSATTEIQNKVEPTTHVEHKAEETGDLEL